MTRQIKRLSPHQNAKVCAILFSVSSLFIVIPIFTLTALFAPPVDQSGNPIGMQKYMSLLFPFFYLIFGYISTLIGCFLYNYFFRFIGGFEFDSNEPESRNVENGTDLWFDPNQPKL